MKNQVKRKKATRKAGKQSGNALGKSPMAMAQPTEFNRRMKGAKGTGLSKCAELYLKALINPWGEFDELPCVPCAPSDMTYKFRAVTRGSFQTSTTTGVGFVSWAPRNPTNDVVSVFSSSSAFLGTGFAQTGTGVVTTSRSPLPFANAAFSAAGYMDGRLVGSALRVKNTTASLYRQGSILASRVAPGVALSAFNANQLQASLESVKDLADRTAWVNWNYVPQDETDYQFSGASVNYSTSNVANANFGILVQGAALSGNVSTFDFEIVEFWEFVSNNPSVITPSLSKSHADSVGLDRVLEAISVPTQSLSLKDQAKTASENVVAAMAHSDSAAKTVEDLLGLAGLALPAINKIVGSLTNMILL